MDYEWSPLRPLDKALCPVDILAGIDMDGRPGGWKVKRRIAPMPADMTGSDYLTITCRMANAATKRLKKVPGRFLLVCVKDVGEDLRWQTIDSGEGVPKDVESYDNVRYLCSKLVNLHPKFEPLSNKTRIPHITSSEMESGVYLST
jgi:hypothetical protein